MLEPSPSAAPSSRWTAPAIAAGTACLALVWRVLLARVYFGHEEEDWGNLVIARGVLDSGFRWIELEHMPGFFWMVAAVTSVVGDTELAALLVSIAMGAATVGLVAWIGVRWYSPAVGLFAGLLVALQPGAALYSSTALRESSYTAFVMLGVLLCGERRFIRGGVFLALGFLVRWNVAFSLLPALVILLIWMRVRDRDGPTGPRGLAGAAAGTGIVGATVLGWAILYRLHPEGGTLAFWRGAVSRNTGGAVADLTATEHGMAVINAVGGLLGRVFPHHMGPAALVCAALGILASWKGLRAWRGGGPDRDAVLRRAWLALCALGTFGFLITLSVITTFEWHHNHYWKWITPLAPFLALLGVQGTLAFLAWLPEPARRLKGGLVVVLIGTTLTVFGFQTRNQIQVSERMYGSQVRLARWIEDAWIPNVGVLGDGIPASYLRRRPSEIELTAWTDPAVPSGDPEALAGWLNENGIGVVIWFKDDWFEAERKAPFLGEPVTLDLGVVALKPVAWSWEYGMLAYVVEHAYGVPPPTFRPPAGTWYPAPGWTP